MDCCALLFTFLFFAGCCVTLLLLLLDLFEDAVTKLLVLLLLLFLTILLLLTTLGVCGLNIGDRVLFEFAFCFLFLPKNLTALPKKPGLAFTLFEFPEPSRRLLLPLVASSFVFLLILFIFGTFITRVGAALPTFKISFIPYKKDLCCAERTNQSFGVTGLGEPWEHINTNMLASIASPVVRQKL